MLEQPLPSGSCIFCFDTFSLFWLFIQISGHLHLLLLLKFSPHFVLFNICWNFSSFFYGQSFPSQTIVIVRCGCDHRNSCVYFTSLLFSICSRDNCFGFGSFYNRGSLYLLIIFFNARSPLQAIFRTVLLMTLWSRI